VLENLVQLYCYDWSELTPLEVGDDGRFEALALAPYWLDDWRHALLLRVDDKLAGFAVDPGTEQAHWHEWGLRYGRVLRHEELPAARRGPRCGLRRVRSLQGPVGGPAA